MYACLDLGSNSFHLLVAEYRDGSIETIERFSARVQLGEGLSMDGNISTEAFERGLQCLDWFREHIRKLPIESMWAVGTNALRQAENAEAFLAEARARGFDIDVIDGEQEAALVYAGVTVNAADDDIKRLVIDIGGGSTELIIGQSGVTRFVRSLVIGCVSWRDKYINERLTALELEQRLEQAQRAAEQVFEPLGDPMKEIGWQQVYASSGTAKMLAAACAGRGDPAGEINRATLLALRDSVVKVTRDNREQLPGVKPARRDVLLSGWCIMASLMQVLEIDRLCYSATALREGMLCTLAGKVSGDSLFRQPHIVRIRR